MRGGHTASATVRARWKRARDDVFRELKETGRSERIRTSDPLHPMQVRYQTAPRSDRERIIADSE